MSYILEALKKSEQKRRRDRIPDLLSIQGSAARKPDKRFLWIFLVSAVLLLNAGLLIWRLYTYKSGGINIKTQNPAVQSNDIPAMPAASNSTAPAEASKDADRVKMPAPEKSDIKRETSAYQPNRKADGAKILGLTELPATVQQAVSNIIISGHFYGADSGSRVVSINGRIVHEGQSINPSLKLERITSEGVILNYEGYRFFRGMF